LTGEKFEGSGKDELEALLKKIFGSKEVSEALHNLMSQSLSE
jgi:hypothetical protein